MFHQHVSQRSSFFSSARVPTLADHGWDAEPGCVVLAAVEDGHLAQRRLDSCHRLRRENACAASRTGARVRAGRGRPKKEITRLIREIKRFPSFTA